MRALIVYESTFGNVRELTGAIAAELGRWVQVQTVEVGEAPDRLPDGVDLLLLGAPTHTFGLGRTETRRTASGMAPDPVSSGRGMREWLDGLHVGSGHPQTAVFFTASVDAGWTRWLGDAGRGLTSRTRRLGLRMVSPAERFLVKGMKGPLCEGEKGHAERWAGLLAERLALAKVPLRLPRRAAA